MDCKAVSRTITPEGAWSEPCSLQAPSGRPLAELACHQFVDGDIGPLSPGWALELGSRRAASPLASPFRPPAVGMTKPKVLPLPSLLSTHTLPPCRSTMDLTIARPRPEPFTWLLPRCCTRKKRSNRRA